jgi:hypothetical protein
MAVPYYVLVALDLLLGFFGILSGLGLRREDWSWGWWLGAAFWGALLGSSMIVLIVLFPAIETVLSTNPQRSEFLVIVPRLLFYVVALAASLYLVRLFWLGPEEGGASRRTIVGWGVLGALCPGALFMIFYS